MALFDIQLKTNPTIFSRKKIAAAAQVFRIDAIAGIAEKKQKLTGWINGIKDGSITSQKEEALCHDFLNLFFGELLDYDYQQGEEQTNLEKQLKNQTDGKKADGALGYFNAKTGEKLVRVVIEIKDGQTDLDKPQNRKNDHRTPVQQAFDYASDAGGTCHWVIVSNFIEIRLYNYRDRGKYELFYITEFLENELELKRFYYLLYKTQLISKFDKSTIDRKYDERLAEQLNITSKFYQQYKQLRIDILDNFRLLNPDKNPLWLLEKTQKLLDRIVFLCFCEDTIPELIPGDTIKKMIDIWRNNTLQDHKFLLWNLCIGLFHAMDKGNKKADIQPFNGGLFAEDQELDALKIDSFILIKALELSKWDFESELNVNILGHIFEQSISDLEDLQAQLSNSITIKDGVRKKDGVFYTPEYITKYMVEEAIGTWLEQRKIELNFADLKELKHEDYAELANAKNANAKKKKEIDDKFRAHRDFWLAYKSKLDNITVLDPACGSGAFLNQSFDYLFAEQKIVAKEIERLFPAIKTDWWEVQRQILMNNLYGVDLNFESVEITKLSLWIKTANKTKPLSFIDNTIKCGNSLIDDPEIAGKKAFDWHKEFPHIFEKGGFDVVIGNPPYGSNLLENQKKYLHTWDSLTPDYEIFYYFITKGLEILNHKGIETFIFPNTFLARQFGRKFRENLINKHQILLLTDLSQDETFEEASVRTCVVSIGKNYIDNRTKFSIYQKKEAKINNDKYLTSVYLQENITNWLTLFSTSETINSLIKKIKNNTIPLGNNLCEVSQGLIPYDKYRGHDAETIKNRIWHSNFKKDKTYKEELAGSDIKKYNINWNGKSYISYGKWLAAPRNSIFFTNPRVLVREICEKSIIASYTEKEYYNTPSIINIISKSELVSLKYILALLNSKLFGWYHYNTSPKAKKGLFPKIIVNDVRGLPIKSISLPDQLPFIEKADKMILLNDLLQKEKDTFLKIFSSSFKVSKITSKLENWYETTFLEFQTEIKKQKIDIPLKERIQWITLFEESQAKIKNLVLEIAQIDTEIEHLVYKLYDLTEEEIKVVESV